MATNFQGLKCWYCGEAASTRDHIVPRRVRIPGMGRKAKRTLRRNTMVQFEGRNTIPACPRCNVLKGNMTLDKFRQELTRCLPRQFYSSEDMRLHRLAAALERFGGKFYGERGAVDAKFPKTESAQFEYSWKQKVPRGTGDYAIRIEEAAKRGRKAQILAGLMNGD